MKNLAIIAVLLLMIAVLDANSDAAENANAAQELTLKQQSIIPIAAFTAHGDIEKLQVALNNGLDNGLTINEIKEVLIQMYAYCGFPRSLNAITAFMTITEERAVKGINDEAGAEPSPLPTDKSREQMGRDVRSSLVGGEFPPTGYALFVPAIDLFLKEHLFGDIFGRDNLDYQSREIATVSALASLNVPQLRGHVGISMRIGLTEEQMNNLASVLNDKVGKREADLVRAELKPSEKAEPKLRVISAGSQPSLKASKENFTGDARVDPLFVPDDEMAVSAAYVTFEPGARTNWHIHKNGQRIIITSGVGLVQAWGEPIVEVSPGDVVIFPAGLKHWHGASPTTSMTHVAITGSGVVWEEAVNDEQYQQKIKIGGELK